jgi:hypothetical protein
MVLAVKLARWLRRDPKRLFLELEKLVIDPDHGGVDFSVYLHAQPLLSAPFNIQTDAALLDRPTLNVVLPTLAMQHMSGGPNTAINLAARVAALGVRVRFISQDVGLPKDLGPLWGHFARLTGIAGQSANIEIVSSADRSLPLRIGANDVFMATAWWTARNVNLALEHTRAKRFIYLIQDYEPAFYPLGIHYAMAYETYAMNYRAVINSRLLAEFFAEQKIGRFRDPAFFSQCAVFDPAVDARRFFPAPPASPAGPFRMLIYARPFSATRNLFEMVVYALNKAAAEHVFDGVPWELSFVGDKIPAMRLDNGIVIDSNSWGDHDANAALMRRANVVVSLILSSHPSYVPLEAAACGAIVVTNCFLNKTPERLVALSPNFVPTEPSVGGIVNALREATRRVREGRVERAHPVNLPRDWGQALETAVASVKTMFEEILRGP